MDSEIKTWFEKPETLNQRLTKMTTKELVNRECKQRLQNNFDDWKMLAEELKFHFTVGQVTGEYKWFNQCLTRIKIYIFENKKSWKIQGLINYASSVVK